MIHLWRSIDVLSEVRCIIDALMLGFVADAEPDVPRIGDELEDARWFTREQIGQAMRGETGEDGLKLSPSISISRWLIETWYAG